MNDLEIYSGRNSHEPSTFSPCARRKQAENKIAEIGYHSMKDIGTSPLTEGANGYGQEEWCKGAHPKKVMLTR